MASEQDNNKYTAAVVDEHSVGPIKTDEDDFKNLQARSLDDMFDESFREFAKWMRNYYTKKYPIPKMRDLNRKLFFNLIIALTVSISLYTYCRVYYFDYVAYWFLPMILFNIVFVTKYQEIAHVRTHWTTNMTGSIPLDKFIDKVMVPFTGMSKETYRRRHVSAHYADIANIARVFSDIWLPFITLPPVYYARPWAILTILLDKEYCTKQKLNRSQMVIEALGLYTYMAAMFAEIIYFSSFYILCFHTIPLVLYQGAVVASASFAHSGYDKRNSFNSNGCFDPDTVPAKYGLLATSIRVIGMFGSWAVVNHGIHHAFTQLPLQIINDDYKFINAHILEGQKSGKYKHVRYNDLMFMNVFKHLFERIPPPQWYHHIVQVFVGAAAVVGYAGTVLGLPVLPNVFEPLLIDYRIIFYSTKEERSAAIVGMWDALEVQDFAKNITRPNAYLSRVIDNYADHKKVAGSQEIPRHFKTDPEIMLHLTKLQHQKAQ